MVVVGLTRGAGMRTDRLLSMLWHPVMHLLYITSPHRLQRRRLSGNLRSQDLAGEAREGGDGFSVSWGGSEVK